MGTDHYTITAQESIDLPGTWDLIDDEDLGLNTAAAECDDRRRVVITEAATA